jgi:hypothetical protein
MKMRPSSLHVEECAYIVNFASVVVVCPCVCNTAEAGEEPLRKRVERVAGYFFLDLPLTRGRMEAEEVFHGSKIESLHVLSENMIPYSGFVWNGQSFLESVLLHLFMVPAEMPHQCQ